MEIQSAPLPPDVLYVVDSALDNHELNNFDHVVLSLYGDRSIITRIIEKDRPKGRGWHLANGAMCVELDAYAHEVAAELPVSDQRAAFASSLLTEPSRLLSLSECLAQWNYEDSTTGGALKPFRRPALLTHDDDPTPKVKRYLYAPIAIRRYVRHCDSENSSHLCVLANRLRRLPWPDHLDEALRLEPHFAEQRNRLQEIRRRAAELFLLSGSIKKRQIKERRHDLQKTMKKSAAVAESILGAEAVRAFLRGEKVRFASNDLFFDVTGAASGGGHGALIISLQDNDDNNLAGLCLFFPHTPALDQLAAIAMHVMTEDTDVLLKTGNLYGVTPKGVKHPRIAERLKKDLIDTPVMQREGGLERRRQKMLGYVESMQSEYLHALTQKVWGTDSKKLVAFASKVSDTFVKGPIRFRE